MKDVDLIILCGGFGTRLRTISKNTPKILCKINEKPFLEHLLNKISPYNFSNVILSCGYLGDQIEVWVLENGFKDKLITLQEDSPLGTGGAILNSSLNNNNDKIVINGDTIFNLDFNIFYEHFFGKSDVGIGLKNVKKSDYRDSGFVKVDKNMNVLSFNEKKYFSENLKYSYINIGVYFFKNHVLSTFSKKTPLSLEYEVFPSLINSFEVKAYKYDDILIDYGTLNGFIDAQNYFSLN